MVRRMNTVSKDLKGKKAGSEKRSLGIIDVMSVLGDDFSNIYSVDRESQTINIYRYENKNVGVKEALNNKSPYKAAIQSYIEANVLQDDKEMMKAATEFDRVCSQLQKAPVFTVHYRVKRNGEILYYYMKCARIGDAENFDKIVFAFASEDSDVRRNELEILMKSGGAAGKRKILIVEDNELNRDLLASILEDKYEIITADDGEKGLKILEKHYKELSLVLLDVQMPVCDGFEFLKRVKEDVFLSSVPIVVTTATNKLDTELTCLNLGAADFITKPYNSDIIRGRINNIIRLKESSMTLAAVEHDELTGLYTEQAFLHYAKTIMQYNPDKKMHVIVGKIRDFKLVNNIYGTKKADEMLCYLASEYTKNLRDGLLARTGSATFTCLSFGEETMNVQRMTDVINQIVEKAPISGLKVKYGVYENVDKSLPISVLCDYAAMAGETIMDNYDCDLAYYTEEIAQKRIYNQMLENSFEDALNNREFILYYQPKIDINTEKVIGAEALVRWKKADGSMVSPGDFIPVYESDGLIERLDEYVFEQVCHLQKEKMKDGEKLLEISVNLSRSSILYDGMPERYIKIVKENGIPFSCVPIELTESAAIYSDRIERAINRLVKAGFSLHMDDFGSGYSSLISLNQLPFTTLKIDKSLIDDVCQQRGKTLVEQVIVLAKLLNMNVIAEGVETKEQLDEIKEMKCDEVQGFYYARPMPEQEFVAYVQENRLK